MANGTNLLRSPGGICAAVLGLLWLACWALLMGVWPEKQWLGVPLLTWSQMAIGVLAIVLSVVMTVKMEAFERRHRQAGSLPAGQAGRKAEVGRTV